MGDIRLKHLVRIPVAAAIGTAALACTAPPEADRSPPYQVEAPPIEAPEMEPGREAVGDGDAVFRFSSWEGERERNVTFPLVPAAGVELSGTVELRDSGDGRTEFSVRIADAPPGAVLPVLLLRGTCGDAGNLVTELFTVAADADGRGEHAATLHLPAATVRDNAIAVEVTDPADRSVPLSCGQTLEKELGEVELDVVSLPHS